MTRRKIIEINRELCNGCGECTTACAEEALVLDKERKAVLLKEIFCDGMGSCLDVCPTGALVIVERESEPYDAEATHRHLQHREPPSLAGAVCPGTTARDFKRGPAAPSEAAQGSVPSQLSQWPIQLHLISPHAPYFEGCDLLIAADCTAFTLGGFHPRLLQGRKLVIACPKLDETAGYGMKLAELFRSHEIKSVTVAVMEVPCCGGLCRLVQQALASSGKEILTRYVTIGLEGEIRG